MGRSKPSVMLLRSEEFAVRWPQPGAGEAGRLSRIHSCLLTPCPANEEMVPSGRTHGMLATSSLRTGTFDEKLGISPPLPTNQPIACVDFLYGAAGDCVRKDRNSTNLLAR